MQNLKEFISNLNNVNTAKTDYVPMLIKEFPAKKTGLLFRGNSNLIVAANYDQCTKKQTKDFSFTEYKECVGVVFDYEGNVIVPPLFNKVYFTPPEMANFPKYRLIDGSVLTLYYNGKVDKVENDINDWHVASQNGYLVDNYTRYGSTTFIEAINQLTDVAQMDKLYTYRIIFAHPDFHPLCQQAELFVQEIYDRQGKMVMFTELPVNNLIIPLFNQEVDKCGYMQIDPITRTVYVSPTKYYTYLKRFVYTQPHNINTPSLRLKYNLVRMWCDKRNRNAHWEIWGTNIFANYDKQLHDAVIACVSNMKKNNPRELSGFANYCGEIITKYKLSYKNNNIYKLIRDIIVDYHNISVLMQLIA